MLEGFTKSKFYTKCKSSLKMTKMRLEALKKRKNTVIKYLKNDMADLLKNGLDYNAYNRAEGLIVEQNMMVCYNFIEQFCGCIATNVSVMNKQRECPEECREAVQSLVFAAARFSEFPELRDLRALFTERYGNLEPYINKEFVGLLKPQPATKEMKLQLMHDVAHEFSIEWNSKSLEQKLYKPPEPVNNMDEDRYNVKKCKVGASQEKNCEDDYSDQYMLKESKNDNYSKMDSRDSSCSFDDSIEDRLRKRNEIQSSRNAGKEEAKPVERTYDSDDLSHDAKPKPRSVRKRPTQTPSGLENTGGVESSLKPPPGCEKAAGERKTAPGIDDVDSHNGEEDEKLLDGLLMHYSKKESPYQQKNDHLHPPGRATHRSEPLTPNEGFSGKRHVRSASAQPEMPSGCSVHPNLPDYDDLAARIVALKGK